MRKWVGGLVERPRQSGINEQPYSRTCASWTSPVDRSGCLSWSPHSAILGLVRPNWTKLVAGKTNSSILVIDILLNWLFIAFNKEINKSILLLSYWLLSEKGRFSDLKFLVPSKIAQQGQKILLTPLKWSCSSEEKRANEFWTVSTCVSSSLDEGKSFFQ